VALWVLFWLENRGSSRAKGLACIRNERKNSLSLSALFALLVLSSPIPHFLSLPSASEEGVEEALGRAGPALAGREAARGAATNIAALTTTPCNRLF
jgi:hypothetical protein